MGPPGPPPLPHRPVGRGRGGLPRDRATWTAIAGLSILNNIIPFTLIVTGQTMIASGLASVINATTPLFGVAFIAMAGMERLVVRKVLGILIGIGGVAMITGSFMAGMFGLGAGWANVPVLNLMMGAPLKISVATSKFLLSITDTSAAWIYLNQGCVIPMMVVPSLIGIMLGSLVGVRILKVAKPTFIRWMVIGILTFAGLKAMHKGLTVIGIL